MPTPTTLRDGAPDGRSGTERDDVRAAVSDCSPERNRLKDCCVYQPLPPAKPNKPRVRINGQRFTKTLECKIQPEMPAE